ncbi:MAG: glutathione S-transferase family protein [Candidatus Competibacteraceae bacterium]|nr:glutathione S-transferase family protein [Candidatus Competibacteraceae bacterium]
MLVNGQWIANWQPVQAKDEAGRFIRQTSQFRHWISADGSPGPTGQGGFRAEPDRYHLYVALICPWASRTLMLRQLKKLDELISVTVVEPALTDQGWRFGSFPGSSLDTLNGCQYLHELYTKVDPHFTGRATVPVLWDKHKHTIVNNESADIIRMLNSAFDAYTSSELDLYPVSLQESIDALNQRLYSELNNGVYQAGFTSLQAAYEEAYDKVFGLLDELEDRLSDGRSYLFGDQLTESDIRLFVTLVRFDLAYHGLFKCNRNLLAQMPNLTAYLERIRSLPGVAETVNVEHIKTGYYSIKALNPNGIVPRGPGITEHDR